MSAEHTHHVTPLKTYMTVFISLLVLTVVTVWVAQIDFGAANALIAFAIATVKAFLVMAWFMHLKYDSLINKITIGSAFFFLLVLFIFCAIDIYTRRLVESTL